MDAIVEGKIGFSEEEINKIPTGLFGIYNEFFVRMREQYGKNNWKANYSPVLRTLLVSFEGLDTNQLSFFTGIEREDLQEILINITPFIEEKFYRDKNKNFRYKLYHQSLVEFLKKEFFDDLKSYEEVVRSRNERNRLKNELENLKTQIIKERERYNSYPKVIESIERLSNAGIAEDDIIMIDKIISMAGFGHVYKDKSKYKQNLFNDLQKYGNLKLAIKNLKDKELNLKSMKKTQR